MPKLRTAVLWIVPAILLAAACNKPAKEGDACKAGTAACVGTNSALACDDGKFVATACKGAKGCHVVGGNVTCDMSGNAAGDPCAKSMEDHSECSPDHKQLASCKSGKFVVSACRGPLACRTEGNANKCDQSISEENTACAGSGYACAVDKKTALQCKNGKFAKAKECAGGKGCYVEAGKVHCDDAPQGAPAEEQHADEDEGK